MIEKIHLLLFLFYSSEAFIIDNYYDDEDISGSPNNCILFSKIKYFPKEIIINFDDINNSHYFEISYFPGKKLYINCYIL